MVLDEGTAEYDAWGMDLKNALTGRFDESRKLKHTTTALYTTISPDGGRVSLASGTGSDRSFSVTTVPFVGGAEIPVPTNGLIWGTWTDSVTLALAERAGAGTRLSLADVRTGQRHQELAIADSPIPFAAPLPDGGWLWVANGGRALRLQQHGETGAKSLPLPEWYAFIFGVRVHAASGKVAILGWNAATLDSLGLTVWTLPDGKPSRWAANFGEGGGFRWLPDGSIMAWVWRTQQTLELLRVSGPDRVESLGILPRPVTSFDVAADLRRAVLVTRDYHGDVWMSKVTRR